MTKLLFESLRGVTLQKNSAENIGTKSCTRCQKIGFEACAVSSEPTFLKFTGQFLVSPDIRWKSKKFDHLFIPWLLDAKIRL
jgi:hypothetical protein